MATDAVGLLEEQAKEIEARIQPAKEAIAQDEQTLARIRAAIDVLQGNVAIAPGASTSDAFRQATARRRSSSGGPTASEIDTGAIVTFVEANQPVGAGEIGKAVGASGNALSVKLKNMVEDGILSKQGERRATRYSLKVG